MTRVAVSLVLIAMTAVAHAEGPAPAFKEGEERMGQPSRILAPEYPAEALREKRGGMVEVTGHVSPLGVLEDAKVAAIPPADEAFADAVREVLPGWLFYVPTDSSCLPDPGTTVTNRVEFSADDGKPHIAVERLASPKVAPRAQFVPTRRVDPDYPDIAFREYQEGKVYVRIDVDVEGKVSEVSAKGYSTRRSFALRSLEGAARRALLDWQFPPPDDGKPWTGCYVINFTFR